MEINSLLMVKMVLEILLFTMPALVNIKVIYREREIYVIYIYFLYFVFWHRSLCMMEDSPKYCLWLLVSGENVFFVCVNLCGIINRVFHFAYFHE